VANQSGVQRNPQEERRFGADGGTDGEGDDRTTTDRTMVTSRAHRITPQGAKAIADKVIESNVIPKKIPAHDDIDAQTKAVGGALASALLTATEMPIHVLAPVVGDLAAQLVALGIRQ